MSALTYSIVSAILALTILYGLHLLSNVKTAVRGNILCALAMTAAILITMYKDQAFASPVLWLAIACGMAFGLFLSNTVKMIQMPQMVAFLHGLGGGAAAAVGLIILLDIGAQNAFERISACLALATGMITIAGSFIAAGKLHQLLSQKPLILPSHSTLVIAILAVMCAASLLHTAAPETLPLSAIFLILVTGTAFGIIVTMRVGGADMPITISLLNAFGGTSAGIAGFAVGDPLLVAIGGIIASSGYMLTRTMCRAMNRKLLSILLGESSVVLGKGEPPAGQGTPSLGNPCTGTESPCPPTSSGNDSAVWLRSAKKVIIIPGYGMALAQAQHKVKQLADLLEERGTSVSYAVHPVAGRMPGHMNVLLAEANVDYEQLLEMDVVNPMFPEADLVLVVGANDVVNPAAMEAEGTPIYGMPILRADQAKHVIVCNYDDKPGYAGVENSLYTRDGVILLQGDASDTLTTLITALTTNTPNEGQGSSAPLQGSQRDSVPLAAGGISDNDASSWLTSAKKVIIVPGYGMALAQAQYKVKQLADLLEGRGTSVSYAVHPVAGRMPGHMNVLLAEANVDYEHLLEMDVVNPMFPEADLVLVVGANDVVNPAAMQAEGTPIYGMPILRADQAKHVIVCNYDDKPGYAGVENTLYKRDGVILLQGDAANTLDRLIAMVPAAEKAI